MSSTIQGPEKIHNLEKHIFIVHYRGKIINTYEFQPGEQSIIIGRDESKCHKVINSEIVSGEHLEIILSNDRCFVKDLGSTNYTYLNTQSIEKRVKIEIKHGDTLNIDNSTLTHEKGVLIEYFQKSIDSKLIQESYLITPKLNVVIIGRSEKANIRINHPKISMNHFKLILTSNGWEIEDLKSTNGTYLNGIILKGRTVLKNNDSIFAVNTKFIFLKKENNYELLFTVQNKGISLDAYKLVKTAKEEDKEKWKSTGEWKTILDDVSISIRPGSFVAIVGGSGAGKSTLMDCLNRTRPANKGKVFINEEDFEKNYFPYKEIIGYVPQKDILFDNLTVKELLTYTAKLRLAEDSTTYEIVNRVSQVILDVGLKEEAEKLNSKLSGGQKKRVSIAIELISKPELIFLDEPTSGLDPGMDKDIMKLLQSLSKNGTTIILITHATANLSLCDKIVFLGKGGKVCYLGSPNELLTYFKENDIADIFSKLSKKENVLTYNKKLTEGPNYIEMMKSLNRIEDSVTNKQKRTKKHVSGLRQYGILTRRYFKLVVFDKVSGNIMLRLLQTPLMLMLLQAPLMLILLNLVSKSDSLSTFEGAKQVLFTISCMAAFMGILNSFMEVCKERDILIREYNANLKLLPYIMSKITILAVVGSIQACILSIGTLWMNEMPVKQLLYSSGREFIISLCLSITAASAMGTLISSYSKTTERATLIMPGALVLQLIFSGVLFNLSGLTKFISYGTVSRWTMSALGTSFDINSLPLAIYEKMPQVKLQPRDLDLLYEYSKHNLITSWGALVLFTIICIVISLNVLKKNISKNER